MDSDDLYDTRLELRIPVNRVKEEQKTKEEIEHQN